jgi:hypothetical protein
MKAYYLLVAIAASIAAIAISQWQEQPQEGALAQNSGMESDVESDYEPDSEAWFI